jgi:hypothetical protein
MKKTKQDLFNYLDWYDFVHRVEISDAILDFFAEEMWVINPSRWDCMQAWSLADEYIEQKWFKLDEHDNIIK